ncbi:unnamed protein product, partial [Meganyctiphanes norvegica]
VDMQNKWLRERANIMNEFTKNLQEQAELNLNIIKKRRIGGEEGKDVECEWITDEIKKEIGEKRDIRKKERKSTNLIEKERFEQERENKKKVIQKLVREAKTKHEMDLNKEIKDSNNKGKLIWKFMDKIRGKRKVTEEDEIFEDGKKMEKGNAKGTFFGGWRGVLTKSKNDSHEIWDKEIKRNISCNVEVKGNLEIGIEEHLRMDSRVEKKTGHMNYEELGKKGLIRLTDN